MATILMLNLNRQGKGTYWRALGFARELVVLGHEVTLLAIGSPPRRRSFRQQWQDGVRIVTSPDLHPNSGYDPWDTLLRVRWLRDERFDLVHAFENRPVVIGPALYLQRRDRVPLIVDWCDWFGAGGSVERRPNPLLRTLLRPVETFFEEHFRPGAQGHTVINSVLREKALALGIPEERILNLPNGASVSQIQPQEKETARARLGLSPTAKIVVYTGAIFVDDARLMAEAFAHLHAAVPETRLLLVGYNNVEVEAWIGPEREHVIRTGPVPFSQLVAYVAAADAGWLPLRDTGANRGRFPMKLHDFIAAGRPVIATDVGDLGRVVRTQGLGVATPPDAASLARAAQELLEDEARLRQIGDHARRVAEEKYAWPILTRKLDAFYRQFLDQSQEGTPAGSS